MTELHQAGKSETKNDEIDEEIDTKKESAELLPEKEDDTQE